MSKIWERAIELNLDEKDVRLLNAIVKDAGFSKEEINLLAKKVGTTANDIKKRLYNLKDKKIILKERISSLDPVRLWDLYLISLVKSKIAPPIIGRGIEYPVGWVDIIRNIKKAQKDLNLSIVRQAFALYGTEWDIMIIFSVNDLNDHQRFMEYLAKQGWIDKVQSLQPAKLNEEWIFDPIASPFLEEFREGVEKPLKKYKKV